MFSILKSELERKDEQIKEALKLRPVFKPTYRVIALCTMLGIVLVSFIHPWAILALMPLCGLLAWNLHLEMLNKYQERMYEHEMELKRFERGLLASVKNVEES